MTLEKIVSTQLISLMNDNHIFEKFQSGFHSLHSTETALVEVANDLLLAADSGLYSILILLDLSSAFDRVDHNVLISQCGCGLVHLLSVQQVILCKAWRNLLFLCPSLLWGPSGVYFGSPPIHCLHATPGPNQA